MGPVINQTNINTTATRKADELPTTLVTTVENFSSVVIFLRVVFIMYYNSVALCGVKIRSQAALYFFTALFFYTLNTKQYDYENADEITYRR